MVNWKKDILEDGIMGLNVYWLGCVKSESERKKSLKEKRNLHRENETQDNMS
jgi:hypothetical protein